MEPSSISSVPEDLLVDILKRSQAPRDVINRVQRSWVPLARQVVHSLTCTGEEGDDTEEVFNKYQKYLTWLEVMAEAFEGCHWEHALLLRPYEVLILRSYCLERLETMTDAALQLEKLVCLKLLDEEPQGSSPEDFKPALPLTFLRAVITKAPLLKICEVSRLSTGFPNFKDLWGGQFPFSTPGKTMTKFEMRGMHMALSEVRAIVERCTELRVLTLAIRVPHYCRGALIRVGLQHLVELNVIDLLHVNNNFVYPFQLDCPALETLSISGSFSGTTPRLQSLEISLEVATYLDQRATYRGAAMLKQSTVHTLIVGEAVTEYSQDLKSGLDILLPAYAGLEIRSLAIKGHSRREYASSSFVYDRSVLTKIALTFPTLTTLELRGDFDESGDLHSTFPALTSLRVLSAFVPLLFQDIIAVSPLLTDIELIVSHNFNGPFTESFRVEDREIDLKVHREEVDRAPYEKGHATLFELQ